MDGQVDVVGKLLLRLELKVLQPLVGPHDHVSNLLQGRGHQGDIMDFHRHLGEFAIHGASGLVGGVELGYQGVERHHDGGVFLVVNVLRAPRVPIASAESGERVAAGNCLATRNGLVLFFAILVAHVFLEHTYDRERQIVNEDFFANGIDRLSLFVVFPEQAVSNLRPDYAHVIPEVILHHVEHPPVIDLMLQ